MSNSTGDNLLNDSIWEDHATWWQETFTQGADEEYEEQMLPLTALHLKGCSRVLDLGTGEGQVARVAKSVAGDTGFVIGVDRSAGQIDAAAKRGGATGFMRADVTELPFDNRSFDAVIACLVFEHVADLEAAIAEVSRVLVRGGRFLLFLNHPAFQTPDSGWIDDQILEEQYWRSGPYLTEQTTLENVDADVTIPFVHRTLSTYVNALAAQGLFVTQLVEPAPLPVDEYPDAATIPRLLFIRSERIESL